VWKSLNHFGKRFIGRVCWRRVHVNDNGFRWRCFLEFVGDLKVSLVGDDDALSITFFPSKGGGFFLFFFFFFFFFFRGMGVEMFFFCTFNFEFLGEKKIGKK
jgi:hypothetical protein